MCVAALIPFGVNAIFVMCDPQNVHFLMVYSQVTIVFLFAQEVEIICQLRSGQVVKRFRKWAVLVTEVILIVSSIMYMRYDNICVI